MKKRHTVEQIFVKHKELEILITEGKTIGKAVRHIKVSKPFNSLQ